jgi:hypothetical protein
MSQYQQIRVRVEAMYKKSLAEDFPRLHQELAALDNRLLHESPALLDLVPDLVRLSQQTDLAPGVAAAVAAQGPGIVEIWGKIETALSGWRLSETERLLNDLEDAFLDLEQALGGKERG